MMEASIVRESNMEVVWSKWWMFTMRGCSYRKNDWRLYKEKKWWKLYKVQKWWKLYTENDGKCIEKMNGYTQKKCSYKLQNDWRLQNDGGCGDKWTGEFESTSYLVSLASETTSYCHPLTWLRYTLATAMHPPTWLRFFLHADKVSVRGEQRGRVVLGCGQHRARRQHQNTEKSSRSWHDVTPLPTKTKKWPAVKILKLGKLGMKARDLLTSPAHLFLLFTPVTLPLEITLRLPAATGTSILAYLVLPCEARIKMGFATSCRERKRETEICSSLGNTHFILKSRTLFYGYYACALLTKNTTGFVRTQP